MQSNWNAMKHFYVLEFSTHLHFGPMFDASHVRIETCRNENSPVSGSNVVVTALLWWYSAVLLLHKIIHFTVKWITDKTDSICIRDHNTTTGWQRDEGNWGVKCNSNRKGNAKMSDRRWATFEQLVSWFCNPILTADASLACYPVSFSIINSKRTIYIVVTWSAIFLVLLNTRGKARPLSALKSFNQQMQVITNYYNIA